MLRRNIIPPSQENLSSSNSLPNLRSSSFAKNSNSDEDPFKELLEKTKKIFCKNNNTENSFFPYRPRIIKPSSSLPLLSKLTYKNKVNDEEEDIALKELIDSLVKLIADQSDPESIIRQARLVYFFQRTPRPLHLSRNKYPSLKHSGSVTIFRGPSRKVQLIFSRHTKDNATNFIGKGGERKIKKALDVKSKELLTRGVGEKPLTPVQKKAQNLCFGNPRFNFGFEIHYTSEREEECKKKNILIRDYYPWTLWDIWDIISTFSKEQRLLLLKQQSDALSFLHLHHYVYLDFKPTNVLINHFLNQSVLTDIGSVTETSSNEISLRDGTIFTMPPEAWSTLYCPTLSYLPHDYLHEVGYFKTIPISQVKKSQTRCTSPSKRTQSPNALVKLTSDEETLIKSLKEYAIYDNSKKGQLTEKQYQSVDVFSLGVVAYTMVEKKELPKDPNNKKLLDYEKVKQISLFYQISDDEELKIIGRMIDPYNFSRPSMSEVTKIFNELFSKCEKIREI